MEVIDDVDEVQGDEPYYLNPPQRDACAQRTEEKKPEVKSFPRPSVPNDAAYCFWITTNTPFRVTTQRPKPRCILRKSD